MLLLCVSSAHAGWWGSRKAEKPAEAAAAAPAPQPVRSALPPKASTGR